MGGCEVAVAVHVDAGSQIAASLDCEVAGGGDVELEVVDVNQINVLGGDRDLVLEVVGRVGELDVAVGRYQGGRAFNRQGPVLRQIALHMNVEFAANHRRRFGLDFQAGVANVQGHIAGGGRQAEMRGADRRIVAQGQIRPGATVCGIENNRAIKEIGITRQVCRLRQGGVCGKGARSGNTDDAMLRQSAG